MLENTEAGVWRGTHNELLLRLSTWEPDQPWQQDWPANPEALSRRLTRLAQSLAADGIQYQPPHRKTTGGRRELVLRLDPEHQAAQERNGSNEDKS
jgi:hypothetical protein